MFIGKEIVAGVFIEQVQGGRWLVRSNLRSGKDPDRVGEVTGRAGKYVAFTMRGDRVAVVRTLKSAVMAVSKWEV